MMVLDRATGDLTHRTVQNLPEYLSGWETWANASYAAQHPNPELHPLYAAVPGSHATPSAGIPLPEDVVKRLEIKTFTLHIGGPRDQPDIRQGFKTGVGWREWYQIPAPPKTPVAAIGTTAVKAMETWARTGQLEGWSDLFIQPPFEFKAVGKLLTNWHFPGEPLLALTCAFGGYEFVREAYEAAVAEKYLFSCYGDRLLII
jgi:S-adenosylmethionine:tRNA ribosyltransferase-isomerase